MAGSEDWGKRHARKKQKEYRSAPLRLNTQWYTAQNTVLHLYLRGRAANSLTCTSKFAKMLMFDSGIWPAAENTAWKYTSDRLPRDSPYRTYFCTIVKHVKVLEHQMQVPSLFPQAVPGQPADSIQPQRDRVPTAFSDGLIA